MATQVPAEEGGLLKPWGKGYWNVLAASQFDRTSLDELIRLASDIKLNMEGLSKSEPLKGKVLGLLFYEPSTRTSSSFHSAMLRLGGKVLSLKNIKTSSVAKGETLEDTVRTLECYCDALVLRHPEKGAALRAAKVLKCPIFNAGDGAGEHPTQALLDMFTIHNFLKMPEYVTKKLDERKVSWSESEKLDDLLKDTDVLYVTRVQKERFKGPDAKSLYEKAQKAYRITPDLMKKLKAKEKMIVMHPLPRVGEIDPALDSDPRAAYFREMRCGMIMRMALLCRALE
ncbi:hypothetical protein AAMO2058_000474200 [Amorphochlora amoebiformis]